MAISVKTSYKPVDASKNIRTKLPAGYYSYKTTSLEQLSKSTTGYGEDKKGTSTKKSSAGGSAANTIKASLKSRLIAGTEVYSAAIEAVKEKVEKSLSDTVMELRKSEDYLKRLDKVYKAGMDSAAN